MKIINHFFLPLLCIVLFNSNCYSQNIRPVRDDIGFCWNSKDMDKLISYLDSVESNKYRFSGDGLVAAISPHDDYLYAGKVYYPLFKLISAGEIVIFGVTHGTVRKEMNNPENVIILEEFDGWKGLDKNIAISPLREKIKSELSKDYYVISNKAHNIEHSIEALIPWLQYYNKEFRITPVMVTAMSYRKMELISEQLAQIITDYTRSNNLVPGKDIFFLISNDANHYGVDFNNSIFGLDSNAHRVAVENDRRIIKQFLEGEINHSKINRLKSEIWADSSNQDRCPLWCGRYPVVFGLLTIDSFLQQAGIEGFSGKLFAYSDTWSGKVLPLYGTSLGITAPFSLKHWVGFFSAGFYIHTN